MYIIIHKNYLKGIFSQKKIMATWSCYAKVVTNSSIYTKKFNTQISMPPQAWITIYLIGSFKIMYQSCQ